MTLKRRARIAAFRTLQNVGFHVVPNHFYEPVPDTRGIPEKSWAPSDMVGIDLRPEFQVELLKRFRAYKQEYDAMARELFTSKNGTFGRVDGEILYCMVREFKPERIVEIGSGYSTVIASRAMAKNQRGSITAIEPYPASILRTLPEFVTVRPCPVQEVPLSEFESLGQNDILFIDSSHVLKEGSDVQYEYMEILPRIQPGVFVHVHDIFLPWPYPRRWVTEELRFWNEQSVLQSLLTWSSRYEVIWGSQFMYRKHADLLHGAFDSMATWEDGPGSFWLRVVPPRAN
jgi:predicted O-methyltransferase YrrM